ncbi:HAMP domain-containing sensor histidine kinase [Paenibacillus xylaniclasticus]|uniref:HAMP domain-containing sensor histidine kinase n=1 Tax=Paenibacillus xylaniclasticus TaxID=588083 RepID=UPI000FDB4713|nr:MULTISPECIES: HAMP domain-containing sensor histidine kinase [Paenibacillus]GFN31387.1 two-component sensor histidine kinase [Paenibacillus curdlanolyticus]
MKDKPLKSQFRMTIVWIVLSSLLATIATYAVGVILFIYLVTNDRIYPADHYEAQLPSIESYIQRHNSALLELDAQEAFEQVIPLKGIDYLVLDAKGERLYGSVTGTLLEKPGELYQRLNTTFTAKGKFVRAVPIIDGQGGGLSGAVLLAYELQPSPANGSGQIWMAFLAIVLIAAPFVYFVLAILLFSKRFVSRIQQPLQMLMEAAHQVKQKNLDFELNYRSDNELGQLCAAFSEMKDELQQSLFAQWRLEEERRSMTEALAHDLKTPLSLILGYSEALMDDSQMDPTGKPARYLRIIKENAEKSSTLVRQMLYISDLESPSISLVPVSVRVRPFVERKVSYYELQAAQRGIRMVTEIRGESDAPVRFDAEKVERILDNIVSNSLEYTPSGGQIRIDVTVQGNRVYCVIGNTGPNFSGKDLERMFAKFYRGEEARGSKGSHSGLGLYIVRQLTEKLGGTVKAYNAESGEACISFDFKVDTDEL